MVNRPRVVNSKSGDEAEALLCPFSFNTPVTTPTPFFCKSAECMAWEDEGDEGGNVLGYCKLIEE